MPKPLSMGTRRHFPELMSGEKSIARQKTIHNTRFSEKRIDTELEELRTKKQEIIGDAAKKGTVIEISVLRQDMEKIKAEYQGLTKHPKS